MTDRAGDANKLEQICELLTDVRALLDGGWHYSSPIIRRRNSSGLLVEHADCLSMVAEVIVDIESVSGQLSDLSAKAESLSVDTVALCNADLPLLARTYKALALAISNAANEAVDALTTPAPKAERKRGGRRPKDAGTEDNPAQAHLPGTSNETENGDTTNG